MLFAIMALFLIPLFLKGKSMNKEFLEVKNVTYKVGFKTILSNIFSLGKGQILTIIGPSGSGKTSILKAIAGLIKPNIGNISFLKIY